MGARKSFLPALVIAALGLVLTPINLVIVRRLSPGSVKAAFIVEIALLMFGAGFAFGKRAAGPKDLSDSRTFWIPLHLLIQLAIPLGVVWFGPRGYSLAPPLWLLWSAIVSLASFQAALTIGYRVRRKVQDG